MRSGKASGGSGDKAFSLSTQERKRLKAATVILSEITRRG